MCCEMLGGHGQGLGVAGGEVKQERLRSCPQRWAAGRAQPRSSFGRRNQSKLLCQGPYQQHHRGASGCHEQLDTTMVTLSNVACSQLIEMRTGTEPLEEEFLALCETTFMCSYTGDAQRKWGHTAHKQRQCG